MIRLVMGGEACQVEPASWIRPGHIWLPSSLTELENVMKRRKQNTKKKERSVCYAFHCSVPSGLIRTTCKCLFHSIFRLLDVLCDRKRVLCLDTILHSQHRAHSGCSQINTALKKGASAGSASKVCFKHSHSDIR